MEQFRSMRQYVEDRADRLGESIRSLSLALGWGESYLDGVIRGGFKMSPERARELGRYAQQHLGKRAAAGGLDEYIPVVLAVGLPWPPPTALAPDVLVQAAGGLDAFSLLELVEFSEYLRNRPARDELIARVTELLNRQVQERPEDYLPEPVLELARRLAALPAGLQAEAVARLGDMLGFVERVSGAEAPGGHGAD